MIVITSKILDKLANKVPPVTREEIYQCFALLEGDILTDDREQNKTFPPTLWFISETLKGRLLKIVYIEKEDGDIYIKTAYDPNATEIAIYTKLGRGSKK